MQPAITIYSSPTCGFCHMAMQYLENKGFTYTEKDITTDEEAYNFVTQKVGQAVTPIITIGDEIIVGFDRPKIDQALAEVKDKPTDKDSGAANDASVDKPAANDTPGHKPAASDADAGGSSDSSDK